MIQNKEQKDEDKNRDNNQEKWITLHMAAKK
jgi:hypothetical protein